MERITRVVVPAQKSYLDDGPVCILVAIVDGRTERADAARPWEVRERT